MKNKWLIALSLLFISAIIEAAPIHLQKITILSVHNTTELEFDLSAKPLLNLMVLKNPERIVLDFENSLLKTNLPSLSSSSNIYIKKISSLKQKTSKVRLVLELNQAIEYTTRLKKIGLQYRYSLILSPRPKVAPLAPAPHKKPLSAVNIETESETDSDNAPIPIPTPRKDPVLSAKNEKLQDLIVVLDPGHGGKDPGAKGRQGTQEKMVVLAIAHYLQKELQAIAGIKVYLTRSTDIFIPLRHRLNIAREHKADLFIALHADAFKNSSAQGASIFALSQRGATSESARWLAEKENESEMLGGAYLSDKDKMLKSVLIDMSQTATINSSLLLAENILDRFHGFTSLHSNKVEQAAFVVLKSPDVPSILIENGFISNSREEDNLRSPDYQQKLAQEIKIGIVNYFIHNAPLNSVFYQNYQNQKSE